MAWCMRTTSAPRQVGAAAAAQCAGGSDQWQLALIVVVIEHSVASRNRCGEEARSRSGQQARVISATPSLTMHHKAQVCNGDGNLFSVLGLFSRKEEHTMLTVLCCGLIPKSPGV